MSVGSVVVVTVLAVALWAVLVQTSPLADDDKYRFEKDSVYWRNVAEEELADTLSQSLPRGVATNVILFLGDGMGATSVTAGRILAGQLDGQRGEETKLSFDHFPYTGLSRTYNVDNQVTDSAASGTAYLTGVKTNQGVLGLNGRSQRGVCNTSEPANQVKSILRWSLDAGKSAGVVTTTRVTHATPGASYAHCPERDWEADSDVPSSESDCEDIALQLVTRNSDIQVVLGGGRRNFLPSDEPDVDASTTTQNLRTDGNNLVKMWQKDMAAKNKSHKFVHDKAGFDLVDPAQTDHLMGLFTQSHMSYEIERDPTKEPSLAEMTEKAIKILRKNNKGFFLLVEGGRIDHGHHANEGAKALHEVVAFAEAVDVATKLVSRDQTLMVVTADHSHVMSVAGYSPRGNPILGKAGDLDRTLDHMPYTTIVYGNGKGYSVPRENLTEVDTEADGYIQQSAVPMDTETHGGEDVSIYARGPQSFLYTGVHEQNYIPIVMAYASCVGPYAEGKKSCARYQQNVFNIVIEQRAPDVESNEPVALKPGNTANSSLLCALHWPIWASLLAALGLVQRCS